MMAKAKRFARWAKIDHAMRDVLEMINKALCFCSVAISVAQGEFIERALSRRARVSEKEICPRKGDDKTHLPHLRLAKTIYSVCLSLKWALLASVGKRAGEQTSDRHQSQSEREPCGRRRRIDFSASYLRFVDFSNRLAQQQPRRTSSKNQDETATRADARPAEKTSAKLDFEARI